MLKIIHTHIKTKLMYTVEQSLTFQKLLYCRDISYRHVVDHDNS